MHSVDYNVVGALYIIGSSTWKVQSIKVKSSINSQTGKSWYRRNLNWKPWCNWKGMYCYLNAICFPKWKHYHTFMETNYGIFGRKHYNHKPGNYLINRIVCKYIIDYYLLNNLRFCRSIQTMGYLIPNMMWHTLGQNGEIFLFFYADRDEENNLHIHYVIHTWMVQILSCFVMIPLQITRKLIKVIFMPKTPIPDKNC